MLIIGSHHNCETYSMNTFLLLHYFLFDAHYQVWTATRGKPNPIQHNTFQKHYLIIFVLLYNGKTKIGHSNDICDII